MVTSITLYLAYEHEKFHTLADGVLGPDRVAALVERLPHLEELDDINRLFEGCKPCLSGRRRNGGAHYLTNGALRYESERSTCQIRHSRRGYPRRDRDLRRCEGAA